MLKTTSNEVPKWEKGDVERNEKKSTHNIVDIRGHVKL